MNAGDLPQSLFTYQDVAERLRCCVKHVRDEYVKTGLLPVVAVGRLVRFRPEDVRKLIDRLAGGE